jgi:restriction system protein
MYERIVANMKLSEEVLSVPHGDGTTSEVEYRLAWARTYLKKVGAVDNSERGIWALTSKGRAFTEKDAAQVVREVRSQFAKRGEPKKGLQKLRGRKLMKQKSAGRKSCSAF